MDDGAGGGELLRGLYVRFLFDWTFFNAIGGYLAYDEADLIMRLKKDQLMLVAISQTVVRVF